MSDIYFNARGQTHHLRILPVDEKPGGITVFEAMTNQTEYTYFEAHAEIEIWELIELAIQSYLDYRVDDEIVKTQWRED